VNNNLLIYNIYLIGIDNSNIEERSYIEVIDVQVMADDSIAGYLA